MQKVLTTVGQNKDKEQKYVRRCTEATKNVKLIYTASNYKNHPFVKRKSVVLKSKLKKKQIQNIWKTDDG